jgi:ATP-dependent RNA helicase RhlE
VATDIAARGIDVTNISHVINFDMPDSVDAYIHRIGRTGRAQATGAALTLCVPEDEVMIREIEHVLGAKIKRERLAGFDYSQHAPEIPSHQNRPVQRQTAYSNSGRYRPVLHPRRAAQGNAA